MENPSEAATHQCRTDTEEEEEEEDSGRKTVAKMLANHTKIKKHCLFFQNKIQKHQDVNE